MQFYIKTSCHLNIMGMEPDGKTPKKNFDPYDKVTRAQFGTVLSRLIYGYAYNIHTEEQTYKRYENHLQALNRDGVMKMINNPFMDEKRARVILMLHRVQVNDLVNKYRPLSQTEEIKSITYNFFSRKLRTFVMDVVERSPAKWISIS